MRNVNPKWVVAALLLIFALAFLASASAQQTVVVERVTRQDTTGDVVARGKRIQGRGDVDIRSVTVTRPSKKKLIVVVETAAPLRAETQVTFRYVSPDGFDEAFIDAHVTPRRSVLVYAGDIDMRGTLSISGASISGRRLTLVLDTWVRSAYLEWYPRFQWMATVTSPDRTVLGVRDHVPNQVDAVIDPHYARFP